MRASDQQRNRTQPRVLAAGLCNVECPTLGPDGWVLNVCSLDRPEEPWATKGGDITVTHPTRPLATAVLFSTSTPDVAGIPAALAFGPDQAIYVADEGRRSVVRVTPSGSIEDFITQYRGRPLNGPNDLSFDVAGDLYFTDPWTSSPANPIASVYRYDWAQAESTLIDTGMEFTNGIVAHDGQLYVAETFTRAIWVYELSVVSKRPRRRLFCRLPDILNPPMLPVSVRASIGVDYVAGPDGMAIDAEGNLWVTHYGGSGVYVYDPRGNLVEVLAVKGTKPTNLCFGGSDLESVFVSVDDHGVVLEYHFGIAGSRLNFCPSGVEQHAWSSVIADPSAALPGRRSLPSMVPPSPRADHW